MASDPLSKECIIFQQAQQGRALVGKVSSRDLKLSPGTEPPNLASQHHSICMLFLWKAKVYECHGVLRGLEP